MRLPDFLGIGTQKGGTTSLHKLLEQDGRIGLPKRKELHYFDQEIMDEIKSYASNFEDLNDKKITGEITPYYMFHPKAPYRIKQTLPNVKLIVLLRDPVERTISQYFHAKRSGYEEFDIEEALRMEKDRLIKGNKLNHQKHSYLHRSIYEKQLIIYENLFCSENLLVLKSEDLFEDTQTSWSKIQEFLGLQPTLYNKKLPKFNSGKGESRNVAPGIRAKLRKVLNPTYIAIKKRYGIRWD